MSVRNNKQVSMTKLFVLLIPQSFLLLPHCYFLQKSPRVFVFHYSAPFEQWGPFFPFRYWSSSRGKAVSAGRKQRKRKQEGVDTLQHQPNSTININLHAQILSTSGRGECDFHELNGACDSVGRWQIDTIIFSSVSMPNRMPSNCRIVELVASVMNIYS